MEWIETEKESEKGINCWNVRNGERVDEEEYHERKCVFLDHKMCSKQDRRREREKERMDNWVKASHTLQLLISTSWNTDNVSVPLFFLLNNQRKTKCSATVKCIFIFGKCLWNGLSLLSRVSSISERILLLGLDIESIHFTSIYGRTEKEWREMNPRIKWQWLTEMRKESKSECNPFFSFCPYHTLFSSFLVMMVTQTVTILLSFLHSIVMDGNDER